MSRPPAGWPDHTCCAASQIVHATPALFTIALVMVLLFCSWCDSATSSPIVTDDYAEQQQEATARW